MKLIVAFLFVFASIPYAQQSDFIFDHIEGAPKCHAVTAVQLPGGLIAAAWFAGQREGSLDQAIYFSKRDSRTGVWSNPQEVYKSRDVPDYNPVLLYDGKGLHLFLVESFAQTTDQSSLWQLISKDLGHTWSPAVRVIKDQGIWTRNEPVYSGRWIIPVSDVQHRGARILVSTDLKSFQLGFLIQVKGHYLTQPAVAVLDQHKVIAVFRERGRPGGHIWIAKSDDSGKLWSTPRPLGLPNPDSGIALLALPDGRLLLVYDNSNVKRTPLMIAISDDDGTTWKPKMVLEDSPGEYSYPTAILGLDRTIHIFYTWKRLRIKHVIVTEATLLH